MPVPTIFDLCVPRDDVLDGSSSDADYAADLSHVLRNQGAANAYADPKRFFANTYPTRGLQNLLANVGSRLTTGGGVSGDLAEAGSALEALENLRKLAFATQVDEPQQLELWREVEAG